MFVIKCIYHASTLFQNLELCRPKLGIGIMLNGDIYMCGWMYNNYIYMWVGQCIIVPETKINMRQSGKFY